MLLEHLPTPKPPSAVVAWVVHRLGGGKGLVAGEDTPSCSSSICRPPSLRLPFAVVGGWFTGFLRATQAASWAEDYAPARGKPTTIAVIEPVRRKTSADRSAGRVWPGIRSVDSPRMTITSAVSASNW
jgi:hypothetical protein